jgi:uncharacterized membrane protein
MKCANGSAKSRKREKDNHTMTMDAKRACKIIGNQPMWAIKNMAKALSLHSWNNTAEENERLEAAKWAIANQRDFDIAISKTRR